MRGKVSIGCGYLNIKIRQLANYATRFADITHSAVFVGGLFLVALLKCYILNFICQKVKAILKYKWNTIFSRCGYKKLYGNTHFGVASKRILVSHSH